MQPVTIASVRAHGVRQWPCHHHGELPIERFKAEETLPEIQRRCRCTKCGRRRADLRPDYSRQQAARQSAGWMMPAADRRRDDSQSVAAVICNTDLLELARPSSSHELPSKAENTRLCVGGAALRATT
jgi:hypothetical protein